MPSVNNNELSSQLKTICENLKSTKNTCALYKFQDAVEKCLEEKKILNRDVIIECLDIVSKLIPSKLLDNLFKKAIELKDTTLSYSLINNVQILEENQAVDCIKFFLNDLKEEEISDQSAEEIEKANKNLNLLFIKPYDYRLFTNELKRLSSKDFLYCLQYLQNFIKNSIINKTSQQDDEKNTDSSDETKTPTILQVVDLFCCFVDAHFTHITLSTKAQEIIADALQLIETQLELYYEFISIESLLKEYKNNPSLRMKTNNNMGHYSIEALKMF